MGVHPKIGITGLPRSGKSAVMEKVLSMLVEERTKELKEQNQKLDKAMKVFVGREHMIRKLQRELSALKGE